MSDAEILVIVLGLLTLAATVWAAQTGHLSFLWQKNRDEDRLRPAIRFSFEHQFMLNGGPDPEDRYVIDLSVINIGEIPQTLIELDVRSPQGFALDLTPRLNSGQRIEPQDRYVTRFRMSDLPFDARHGFTAWCGLANRAWFESEPERLERMLAKAAAIDIDAPPHNGPLPGAQNVTIVTRHPPH